MTDIRNGVVLIVPGQWMPAVSADGIPVTGGDTASLAWRTWDGNPAAWSVTLQQTNTCSAAFVRALGAVVSAVAAGGGGSTVAAVSGTDPKCVVGTATVLTRSVVTCQFQDQGTSANLGARCDLDIATGYAARVGDAFATMRVFGL